MTIIKYRHYSHQNSIQFFLVMVICSVRNQSIKLVHWKKQWTIITCFQTHLLDTCNKGYKRPLIFTPLLLMVRCNACKWPLWFCVHKDKRYQTWYINNIQRYLLFYPGGLFSGQTVQSYPCCCWASRISLISTRQSRSSHARIIPQNRYQYFYFTAQT